VTSGRIAVVTGSTSGIGRAVALSLLKTGARIVATGRSESDLEDLAAIAGPGPGRILTEAADVRHENLIEELFAAAEHAWDAPPDLLVLAAGRGLPGSVLGSDAEQWQDLVEINYVAVMRHLRAGARLMVADARAAPDRTVRDIVVIGSSAGRLVSPANPVYGSTKFAVHAAVEGLRQEICAEGIRVTVIEPGFVATNFQERAGYDRKWFAGVEAQCGPLLTATDIARTVEFVIGQPPHLHLDYVRIRPTRQRL
jgi:NADP-dependent 3-hydroxy acid dehydrogenase YdfG